MQQKRRHTPEFSLAVAVCRWPPSEERAAQVEQCFERPIDWPHFLRIVNRHRIAGLANHALAASDHRSVPPEVMLALQNSAGAMARQGLYAASEVSRLTAVLQDAGIPCVVLKGAPLAVLAYQNLGIRHSKDNDLLVSPRDVRKADVALLSAGYTRVRPGSSVDEKHVELYIRHNKEFEYLHNKTGQSVELHSRLHNNRAFGRMLDIGDGEQKWQSVELGGGRRVDTLCEDDLLEYLCAHGSSHTWFRLKWLADVGALLAKSPDASSRLLEKALSQGTERSAMQGLILCHHFWNTPLPPQMRSDGWQLRGMVWMAYAAMSGDNAVKEPKDRRFGTTLNSMSLYLLNSSPRYLCHQLLHDLLLPVGRERLPARLRFLYPLLRLPIWVVRKLGFRKAVAQ
jgi:hypothetical protein